MSFASYDSPDEYATLYAHQSPIVHVGSSTVPSALNCDGPVAIVAASLGISEGSPGGISSEACTHPPRAMASTMAPTARLGTNRGACFDYFIVLAKAAAD